MIDEGDKREHDKPIDAEKISVGGEDDASTEIEGDDSHLHDDQKARTSPAGG